MRVDLLEAALHLLESSVSLELFHLSLKCPSISFFLRMSPKPLETKEESSLLVEVTTFDYTLSVCSNDPRDKNIEVVVQQISSK